ncbi:hypothetical protein H6G00_15820 [Leptolyngbya sp. FACHB-541]|uniref:hypothetical protein n=1 Tax=Leptolyngbya sp. FACHB-541 TaxID=2692810 RepID=UPI001683F5F7|nr:hypothetical protein [Leptolyngbya sp. FACHB-541]MBD1998073.1 hypothetical protein [Leptolyngbya sp. FACHB-541]
MNFRNNVVLMLGAVGLAIALSPFSLASEPEKNVSPPLVQPPVELVPARTLATYPRGYFLENIVIDVGGTIYITENKTGQIIRRTFNGEADIFSQVDVGLAGLGIDVNGTLIATGHAETGEQYIFEFAEDGTLEYELAVPEAGFLNGLALFRPGVFLIADSTSGTIWQFDRQTQQVVPWLRHDSLNPNPDMPAIPGANGIKLFEGAVYITNSGQGTVTRVPIQDDGSPGEPEVIFSGIVLDDFAFSTTGNLYGTTHIFNSVVVLSPDGNHRTIATAEQGVTGSTALAFGVNESDRHSIYVVGDGGIFSASSEEDIVEPELVQLDVGELGIPQEATLDWMGRPRHVEAIETQLVQCTTAPNTENLRTTIGPRYLRYLELHLDHISYAGQLYGNGRANTPSDRLYFVQQQDPEAALELIQNSPYYRAGVYSECTVTPFTTLLGNTLDGVAWPQNAIYPRE